MCALQVTWKLAWWYWSQFIARALQYCCFNRTSRIWDSSPLSDNVWLSPSKVFLLRTSFLEHFPKCSHRFLFAETYNTGFGYASAAVVRWSTAVIGRKVEVLLEMFLLIQLLRMLWFINPLKPNGNYM